MKLDYSEWNESDKAAAKVRFVKNEVELSEKRMLHIVDSRIKKIKKMAILTAISTVILMSVLLFFAYYRI